MKKSIPIVILLVFLMSIFGCQKETVVEEPVTPPEEPVEEEPLTDYYEELTIALENGDLIEIERLMDHFLPLIDQKQADDVLTRNIQLKKDRLSAMTDQYYSEAYYGLHSALSDARSHAGVEFASPTGFIGKSKWMILDLIEDESFKNLVSDSFNQGYGLLMAEGTYYPVVDYVILDDKLTAEVSNALSDYLDLMSTEQLNRTLVEEYLAIELEELAQRAVRYETFLKDHPGFHFTEDVRINLMVTLYKLALPTPFDGLLDESYMFSESLAETYQLLKEEEGCLVIQYVVNEITSFAEEKGGVLGSYSDLDDLYEKGYSIHQTAGQMIEDLYLGK